MPITFQFQTKTALRHRRRLKNLLLHVANEESFAVQELQIVFCDDNYLLGINQTYLGHDFFTDIITFDLSEFPRQIIGELYISVDTVMSNSNLLLVSYQEELRRVMIHGLLHLCGYKDKTKEQKSLMRAKEDFYLGIYMNMI